MREGRKRMSQAEVLLNEVMTGVTESLMNNCGSNQVTFSDVKSLK